MAPGVPIKQEMGGTLLPKAAFENQELIISDTLINLFPGVLTKAL